MMKRVASTFVILGLTACAAAPVASVEGVAAQKMLAEPLPEYAAKLRVARQIALSCERLTFNDSMQVALTSARPDTAGGRLEVVRNAPGIALATDVELRSFQAKHGLDISADNLCAAGDREIAEQTGISALLIAG